MRLMASLSPEQRDPARPTAEPRTADADLASEMAQLADNLRALRPGWIEQAANMRPGGEPSPGYSAAVEAVADLADLEALEAQLSQGDRSRRWTMWTSSCWQSTLSGNP